MNSEEMYSIINLFVLAKTMVIQITPGVIRSKTIGSHLMFFHTNKKFSTSYMLGIVLNAGRINRKYYCSPVFYTPVGMRQIKR